MLTRLRVRYPRAFQLVAFITALSLFMWACAPALALTPAGTVISAPAATATGTNPSSGGTVSGVSNVPSTVTVWDVYGVEWASTATGGSVAPGSSVMYRYVFRNEGNVDTSSASSTFYYSAAGNLWIKGLYLDAGGTQAATGVVKLPPNAGNEFEFYVKVQPPAGIGIESATTTVTVENHYYQVTSSNDKFGDPDRVTHSVVTSTTDTVPPALTVSTPPTPADGVKLTINGPTVTGVTEAGALVKIVAGGTTYNVTADAGGNFSKTVTLVQGSNTITVTASDGVNESAPNTRTVSVDSIPPTVEFTNPAANASLVGIVSVAGTAADTNFSAYSLHYGPGESPTAWGTLNASDTVPVTSGALGTWDASRLYGTYTLRLAAVDTYGNSSVAERIVRVDTGETLTGTIEKGKWTMLSLPGLPHDPRPESFLGSGRYEIQRWDPTDTTPDTYLLNYKRAGEFVIEGAGFGFWVKPYEGNINYSVDVWMPDTTKDYGIEVYEGWNQVGAPYDRDKYATAVPSIKWDNFRMKRTSTGEEKTMSQAIAAGWINGSYYKYENGGYVELGQGDELEPYKAYFVRAYVDGELLLYPGAGMPESVARIVRPEMWKVRLEAESASGRDTDNFAVLARGAAEDFDPLDSGEPPIVRPYVSLYFPHDEWSRNAGKYARDTRGEEMEAPEEGRPPEKEWRFVVETSNPGEEVKLRVPDAGKLPKNYEFSVRDTATGREFDPRTYAEYTYTDDGSGSREFVLKAKKLGSLPEVELSEDMPAGWNMISVPLEPEETDVRTQTGVDLNDITVFQYYDGELYHPESREKVDIQAGIGYWMHLEVAQRVDFKGVRTDPAKPVEVPLEVGWNLIGNPYEEDMEFGDNVVVRFGGEEAALSEAVEREWVAVPMYTYMAPEARYVEVGHGDTLEAWRGYAIKVLVKCDIVLKP